MSAGQRPQDSRPEKWVVTVAPINDNAALAEDLMAEVAGLDRRRRKILAAAAARNGAPHSGDPARQAAQRAARAAVAARDRQVVAGLEAERRFLHEWARYAARQAQVELTQVRGLKAAAARAKGPVVSHSA